MGKKLSIVLVVILIMVQLTMGGVFATGGTTNEEWFSKSVFSESVHDLGEDNTGIVNITFDFVPLDKMQDSNIGYADSSTVIDEYSKMSMIIAYNIQGTDVNFVVRNGSIYQCAQVVNVINNKLYHFRIAANLSANTYSVYVTPDGESEKAIAVNYAFRTGAPAMDDVGQLSIQSAVNSAFKINHHYINRYFTIAKSGEADYLASAYANDAACIQAALNEVPSGSKIIIRSGTYNITSVLSQSGKDLDITGAGDVVFNFITSVEGSMSFSGSVAGAARMLTQNASKGTYQIVLDSGANIIAGDLIKLNNTVKWAPDDPNYSNQLTGEMYMIKSVSGNTVTITQPLMRDYLTSVSSKAVVYRPIRIRIDNIKFIQGIESGSTDRKDGLTFDMCKESALINCKIENFGRVSLKICKCFDMLVSGCTIRNANMLGNGYGVDFLDASTGIRIVDNYIENCRHCITSGALANDSGLNRGIVISDNIIIGSNITDANVIDSHQCSIDYTITNNIIYCYSDGTNQYAAFYDGTQQSTFSNNQVYGGVGVRQRGVVPGGIHIISNNRVVGGSLFRGVNANVGESIIITGNDVRNSLNVGISVTAEAFKQYTITDNTIYNCAGDGIDLLFPSAAVNPANAVISNNNILKVNGNGIYVKRSSSSDVLNCVITGNVIQDANQGNGGYNGIKLEDIYGAMVSDNVINNYNGVMTVGIGETQLMTGCSNWNCVHDNIIKGATTAVNLIGSNSINRNNVYPN